jgi:outer membrane protein TolC
MRRARAPAARNSVGTTVAGGMLASTFLSIVFIPVLYVVIRTLAPGKGRGAHTDEEPTPEEGSHGKGAAVVAMLLILCLVAPAGAQTGSATAVDAVGFEEAINRALEKNPTVGIAASNILRAQGLMEQIRSGTRPRVTAGITNTTLDQAVAFGDSVVQPRNQSVLSLSVSAPILAAAQWAATAQARDRVEIARLATADTKRQVAVSAAGAYLAVIAQKRLVEIAERSLETARSQADYNRKRREGGFGSRLNELRSAQIVSADEGLVENFRLGLSRAQEALGVILGENGPMDAKGEPVFEVSPTDTAEGWLDARADLRLLSAEQRAAKKVLDGSSKDWWPTVSMNFDPQYQTPKSLFSPQKSWRLTFELTQTLYNGGERAGVQLARKANVQAADYAAVQGQIRARSEKRAASLAVESYERALASARRGAEQAAEVLKITIAAFDAGASTNIEVIEAQRSARDAETALGQAEDALRLARFDLLVALGRFPR